MKKDLFESSIRFSSVYKGFGFGIWEWDLQTLVWDQSMFSLYGIEDKNVSPLYEIWKSAVHPDDIEFAEKKIRDTLRTRNKLEIEFRIIRPDRSVRTLRSFAAAIHDETCRGDHKIIGISLDITEADIYRGGAEDFSKIYACAAKRTGMGIWDWEDMSKDAVKWSPEFYELLGYRNQEVPASWAHFQKMLHPHDQESISRILRDDLDTHEFFDMEYRLKTKGGPYKWFRGVMDVIKNTHGHPTRMVGSIQDIHAQKRAEEELCKTKNFLENITRLVPSIIYIYNQATQSNEYGNRNIGEIMGYTAKEIQALGSEFMLKLCHSEDLPAVFEYFKKISHLKDGEVIYLEYRMQHKNGSYVWLLSTDTIYERAPDGSVLRHIGVATDITKIKEAATKLKETNQILEATVQKRTRELRDLNMQLEKKVEERTSDLRKINSELEELAYVTTHDLKSPVNTIESYLDFLKKDKQIQDSYSLEAIRWIDKSVVQAQKKIESLISVAKFRKNIGQNLEPLSFENIFAEVQEVLHKEIERSHAKIQIDFDQAPEVCFSRHHLSSILENLISNAIKYRAHARIPEICVRTRENGDSICLAVRDNGLGIDVNKDIKKVFGLFKRAHKTIPGNGIGLYMIKHMMERTGGRVELESTLGQGSTFKVFFKKSQAA